MSVDLSVINVLAELERIGWAYEFAGDAEIKVQCPFHDDKRPSCGINLEKKVFKCQTAGCGADGDVVTFLAKALQTTRRVVFEDLSTRYPLDASKIIESAAVERYHEAIWNAGPMLKELKARGITDSLIRKYRIGFHNGRVTIPITNENGFYVNVRRYLPGAPGPEKMRNLRGHGQVRLFPLDQLKYEKIVVCGGELKAILTAHLLNKFGIGAITATAGEGNWEVEFSKLFRNKHVWVMFDIDPEGSKAADSVCARLKSQATWVGKVVLPLDADAYPHGDINDYVGQEGATAKDVRIILDATEEWVAKSTEAFDVTEEATPLHLANAVKAEVTGKRIKVHGIVAAMDTSPFVVPSKIAVHCDRNQELCSLCPIYAMTPTDDSGAMIADISPESPALIEMVSAPKSAQHQAIMEGLRIPTCKCVEFRPLEYFNVEDVRLSPALEITARDANHILQPALCIGHGLELNEGYELTGRMFPHPKTQQSVLLISSYVATQDALTNYKPGDSELLELSIFQPEEQTIEAIQERLEAIYKDFEANVTRIYLRRDLHLIVDLVYHSVLLLPFDRQVVKGWVEALICGDSSQGKSETVTQLMKHYGLGEKMECKNATVAGLLGGLQQMGTRWFVTWGIIPTHDKRLVVLEELKGASTEVIGRLTDMRSSGIAEIPKIEKRRTHARTRLIAVSNPRSDQPLASYNFGIEAIRELIGGLEDIRRFDTALLVSSSEIDVTTLNDLQRHRPREEHRYTAELCRRCVLWAWTRTPDQVTFTDDAHSAVLDEATRLCNIFTEQIPLVDRGSMRFKLARLATSLACRLFSCGKSNPNVVVVRAVHVAYVSRLLERLYSSSVFGYADFSNAIKSTNVLLNPADIRSRVLQVPFPADFLEQVLHTNEIELRDICDWCGWDKSDALQLLSFLVRKHALVRDGRAYRKSPPFIELLKQLKTSPELKAANRPDFIQEEF